jgi:two-component system sensor kinase
MSTQTDMSAVTPAGQECHRLASELESARKELAVFSYSVSHDLRAPLRAVDGFSRILVEDYADRLDDDGRRMLGVIRSEAQRMGRMIDALLVFSRLGRQEMIPESIDMHEMAKSVFDELAAREPGRKLQLDLKPLPPACGTREMILHVWENLIGNAIKFTRGREPGVIEIGARNDEDGVPVYSIKDNGAGFDMLLAGKIFGIFQRFHSEEEFPGIGIGLALAQRIIHRHGGEIRADAQVGRGATFHFTLANPKS